MIKYLQLPFLFDADKMLAEVKLLESTSWQLHYQVKHYEGDWSALPLRSMDGNASNIIIAPTENAIYQDTFFLTACSYIKEVLSYFKCTLQAVRLLKLNAGAIIKEHKDAELCFEKGEIRLHIPIITNADVDFYLDKEKMVLQQGECWYMNFNLPHSLHNKSNTDRIHLVIDAEVNDWVKDLFSSLQIKNKKEIAEAPKYSKDELQAIIKHLRSMNTATANKLADDMEKELAGTD